MGATDELVAYVHFDLMWPYRLSKRILGPKGVRALGRAYHPRFGHHLALIYTEMQNDPKWQASHVTRVCAGVL